MHGAATLSASLATCVSLGVTVVSYLQVNHLRCLHEFVEAQAAYYKRCHVHMQELQKELGR